MQSDARCALHPDRPAAAACARCGTFACSTCLVGTRCIACSIRVPASSDLPAWERRELRTPMHHAFIVTVRDMLTDPRRFFESVAAGDTLRPAFELAMLSASVTLVVSRLAFAVAWQLSARRGSIIEELFLWDFAAELLAVLFAPLRVLATAALVLGAARVTGLRLASFKVTARAVGYLSPLGVLSVVPRFGWPIFAVASAVYASMALASIHRVPWYRGLLALLPLLAGAVAVASLWLTRSTG